MGWSDVVAGVRCAEWVKFGSREMRCLLGIFQCCELTRAFAVTYLCDFGIAWSFTLLGWNKFLQVQEHFQKGERDAVSCWVGGPVIEL